MSSLRVFHVLTESEPFSEARGGAVSRWVANVVAEDERAIVVAPSSDGTWPPPAGRLRLAPGLNAYRNLKRRAGPFLRRPVDAYLLRRLLASALADLRKGDTVWVHNRPAFAAALAPLVHGCGARLVLHLHNSHLAEFSPRAAASIRADAYVFLTRFLEQEATQSHPQLAPTAVTYSGADTTIFFPRTPAAERCPPKVLFVGRLVPEKGVHIFLAAMEILQRRGVAVTGMVVGASSFAADAPVTPYMQGLARARPANVEFLPYCSGAKLGEVFRKADIFCMPSIWNEALGLVVIEAMASGLPVVATNTGGIPELLAHGGGVLVKPGCAASLAAALEQLATDAAQRSRLGQDALRSFQARFTWVAVRNQAQHILSSLGSPAPRWVEAGDAQRESVRGPGLAQASLDLGPFGAGQRSAPSAGVEDECKTFPMSA